MSNRRKSKLQYSAKKRRHKKARWFRVLLVIILPILTIFGGYKAYEYIMNKKNAPTEYRLGENSVSDSKAILSNPHNEEGNYEIKDFQLYAESLGLYADVYDKDVKDALVNKSVMLRNLVTEEEYVYLLTNEIDNQIPLYELSEGVYEVFISSVLKNERVYMDHTVYDEFYTITRNKKNNRVKFMADKNYYYPELEELNLDREYLFIDVSEAELPEDYYDVLIDPGHNTHDYGPILENGHAANGMIEAEENLKASLVMEEVLKKAGLKVKCVRYDNDNVVDTYGKDGRMGQVFKSKAKYYISNHLNSLVDKSVHGSEVYYSSYASSSLAESVLSSLVNNTDLVASGYVGNGNSIPSVVPDLRIWSERANKYHDSYMMIREPGGRSTGAGERSDEAYEKNAPIIAGTHYGAQAILIEYLYMSNVNDAAKWKANYEKYATVAANGIIDYLKLDINTKPIE